MRLAGAIGASRERLLGSEQNPRNLAGNKEKHDGDAHYPGGSGGRCYCGHLGWRRSLPHDAPHLITGDIAMVNKSPLATTVAVLSICFPAQETCHHGHRMLYVLGFGIGAAILSNMFIFIYFASAGDIVGQGAVRGQSTPSVTDIGLTVGLNQTSSFTAAFRGATGYSDLPNEEVPQ
jgi:AraC-like DNA-binding protein